MDSQIRRVLEGLRVEKSVLDKLTRVISSTGVFDSVSYSVKGFNGIEMKKGDAIYRVYSGGKTPSEEHQVLESLFDKFDSMEKIKVKSRVPYKVKYENNQFLFYKK